MLTDTHLGSKYTNHENIFSDVHEGLSNRPGHYYECTHIGYSEQLNHSREIFSQWTDTPIYMIDGNHDRWYIKSNGALIVEELCRGQENLHFIGHDEGDIEINGITIKLWHGEDSSSYAISYRLQKLIESLTGGEKPNALIAGHVHKSGYIFERNVHCLSAGCIQGQSKWMRGKRIAAHKGFWTVRITIDDAEIKQFNPVFYPFYR